MKTVEDIIDAGGGITEFSNRLTRLNPEKPVSAIAVTSWKVRGVIPKNHWGRVLELKDDKGKHLCTEKDLQDIKIKYLLSTDNL